MKIVKLDESAILQRSGALFICTCDSRFAGRCVFTGLFEIQARQPEPLAAAVSLVPSTRNGRTASGIAGSRGPRALRRLSREGVCKRRPSDLHDLSHGRAGGNSEAVSAAGEFRDTFRSWASPEPGKSRLCELSSSHAWWGRSFDTGWL